MSIITLIVTQTDSMNSMILSPTDEDLTASERAYIKAIWVLSLIVTQTQSG